MKNLKVKCLYYLIEVADNGIDLNKSMPTRYLKCSNDYTEKQNMRDRIDLPLLKKL